MPLASNSMTACDLLMAAICPCSSVSRPASTETLRATALTFGSSTPCGREFLREMSRYAVNICFSGALIT